MEAEISNKNSFFMKKERTFLESILMTAIEEYKSTGRGRRCGTLFVDGIVISSLIEILDLEISIVKSTIESDIRFNKIRPNSMDKIRIDTDYSEEFKNISSKLKLINNLLESYDGE